VRASLSGTVKDVDQLDRRLRETIVRVVRTSSPDVDRRDDPRYEVRAPGMLVEKQQRVTIRELVTWRGLADESRRRVAPDGETGRLEVADANVTYKVLGKDKSARMCSSKAPSRPSSRARFNGSARARRSATRADQRCPALARDRASI